MCLEWECPGLEVSGMGDQNSLLGVLGNAKLQRALTVPSEQDTSTTKKYQEGFRQLWEEVVVFHFVFFIT